jgi:2-methylcitrate dehydratase
MSSSEWLAARRFAPDALREVAAYASDGRIEQEAACEAAYYALLDALARLLRALRDPECTRFLGPVVPGATLAFGARVPGTSYVLDPVQAASNIGMLIDAARATEPASCSAGACFADTLGAILPVADFLSRQAVPQGKPAATVQDLLCASIKARELQRCFVRADHLDRSSCVMLAAAAVSAAMFGASRNHVAAALAIALQRARPRESAIETPGRWGAGEAVSQGVRLALLALAGPPAEPAAASGSTLELDGLPGEEPPCVDEPGQLGAAGASAVQALESAIAAHFPTAQANKLRAVLADRARLVAMPVHEFVSLLVRN